jgi:ribose transport system permease protein
MMATDQGTATVPAAAAPDDRPKLITRLRGWGIPLILLVLVVYFSFQSEFFLTARNLLNVAAIVAVLGIMSMSQTFLMIAGGIDISIGAVAAFTGVIIGRLIGFEIGIWPAVIIALVVGVAVGALQGTISVKGRIDPLVVTLGGFSIFTGLAFMLAERTTLVIRDEGFSFLGIGKIAEVPVPFVIFMIVFFIALVVERRTTYGRSLYAIGGNLEAARLAGITVDRTRLSLYMLSGLTAAMAGVLITAQIGASSPNIGSSFLLSVVTAVILGGASLAGGRGSVVGTLGAVAILGVLQNGFALMQVSSFAQQVVLGILLIGAVGLDQAARRWG